MDFDPNRVTFFAKTDARGQQVSFGIKAKDRQRHMYVIGKTGMGKSTLLENMAVQDIKNGEGVAFIDPHGSAAETLLEYIPKNRIDDVVYFAPFDMEHPISFNVMEDVGPEKRHLVVSGLMSTFKKIWVDAWSARMEYILTNALLALLEYPDSTLLSVNRMLSDKVYRKKVIENITDPAVRAYWVDEFGSYTERFAAEALPAIQNKIGQFTGNPLIRNIIGQPHSSFDIREIMDNKKILIMNLSKGLLGETNANLLGSMLTTRIYLAAMSRANLSPDVMKTMPNFYFYVDEFQSFANSTFANILSEARKYHLNLIMAHQYIEQMDEEVRDAVFGNVGTTIAFRVGPFDAEVLETVYTPTFLAPDLVNLGFAQIYLTLMIDGIGSKPFSAITLPPIEHADISYKDIVIEKSRKNFTSDRASVEQIVEQLHAPEKPSTQNSRGGQGRILTNKKPPHKPHQKSSRQPHQKSSTQNSGGGQERILTNKKLNIDRNNHQNPQKTNHQDSLYKKPIQNNAAKVADLRSTLRKVVGNNSDATNKSSINHQNNQDKSNTNKKDLKSAINTALNLKNISKPKNTRLDIKQPNQKQQSRPDLDRSKQKQRTPPQAQPALTQPKKKEEVSPKELERMMRITTSDKPPS